MNQFTYRRAATVAEALALRAMPGAQFIAGGMDLVPLLSDDLAAPNVLIDIARIPDLGGISYDPAQGLRLGALATLAQIQHDPAVGAHYPVLSRAIAESASPQIRNLATIGGNLMQQPRCPYYRDGGFACLRRDGGDECSALLGETERMAIFGTPGAAEGPRCVAVHPSDAINALATIDGAVVVRSLAGERTVPILEWCQSPSADSTRATVLEPNEIITAITAPPPPANAYGEYMKVRERASYAFAIVSAAAVIARDGDIISHARFALGGVTWGPYHSAAAEVSLVGGPATPERIAQAARLALEGAQPLADNEYKIPMAQAALRRAITAAARRISVAEAAR